MQLAHRLGDAQIVGQEAVLDHRQHERGHADLEVGRDLGQVGVADESRAAAA